MSSYSKENLIKIAANLILSFAFLLKANEAIVKYSRKDTLMVTKQLHPKKQIFPSITICKELLREGSDLSEQQRAAEALDAWMGCQFQSTNVSVRSDDPGSPWKWRQATKHLKQSFCFTFDPPNKVTAGFNTMLNLDIRTNTTDKIYLIMHDKKQNIPLPLDFLDSSGQRLTVPSQENKTHRVFLSVSTEIVTRLAIRGPPCDNQLKIQLGIFECLESFFQESLGNCLMPWNVGSGNSSLPECGSNGTQHYRKYMNKLLQVPTFENFHHLTGCTPSCVSHVFSYVTTVDETYASDQGGISLSIILRSNGVVMKREALVFDTLDMIGNIGGYLGLFLGWSLLSLFGEIHKKATSSITLC